MTATCIRTSTCTRGSQSPSSPISFTARASPSPASGSPCGSWRAGRPGKKFFAHRCVNPLKKVADTYPELFRDLLDIFNGKKAESRFDADTAILLHPLPLVPVLICYWKPEEGMASSLNIFFDSTADKNMGVEFIYRLVAGLVIMFEKISRRHGVR